MPPVETAPRSLPARIGKGGLRSNALDYVVVALITLTSSFDIVGVVSVGGLTVRVSQLLIVLGMVLLVVRRKRIMPPLACAWLFAWLMLQFFAALTSSDYKYSFGYFFWTVLSIFILVLFQNVCNSREKANWLFRVFVHSFVAMSALGMVQWVLGFVGINFCLTQPTLNGTRIPRLNGFTYEPSYYSTYLLAGWTLIMYLAERGSSLFERKRLACYALLVSAALFLSTSRMGWIFMIVWLVFRAAATLVRILRRTATESDSNFMLILFVGFVAVCLVGAVVISKNGSEFLVAGLGIGGTSAHSSTPRITAMINTFGLISRSPLIGLSIGGVPVEYCRIYHLPMDTGATMCVWAELFAASGIIGTVLFLVWFCSLLHSLRSPRFAHAGMAREAMSLWYGIVFECMILAMNQSFLRVYFWVLLAVANAFVLAYKKRQA